MVSFAKIIFFLTKKNRHPTCKKMIIFFCKGKKEISGSKGKASVDRDNKDTLPLTAPRSCAKSSTEDFKPGKA